MDAQGWYNEILSGDGVEAAAFDASNTSSEEDIFGALSELESKPKAGPKTDCECGGKILKMDYDLVCDTCGYVQEGRHDPESEFTKEDPPPVVHFRITGAGAYQLQSNLYKSSTSNYSATQKLHNERTFQTCFNKYVERGLRPPVPNNVCRKAADLYHQVQKQGIIRRAETRNVTIAACLFIAGTMMGSVPPIQEIANFMNLSKKGISTGTEFLLKLWSEGKITFDPTQSITPAKVQTLVDYLGLGDQYSTQDISKLKMAILDVVDVMTVNNIGSSLHIETKVIGATYCVLQRAKTSAINIKHIPITEFCQKCKTRKNTVSNVLSFLNDHHSYFVPVYEDHDLVVERFG